MQMLQKPQFNLTISSKENTTIFSPGDIIHKDHRPTKQQS